MSQQLSIVDIGKTLWPTIPRNRTKSIDGYPMAKGQEVDLANLPVGANEFINDRLDIKMRIRGTDRADPAPLAVSAEVVCMEEKGHPVPLLGDHG